MLRSWSGARHALLLLLACGSLQGLARAEEPPPALTLPQAVQEAFARSPVLRVRQAALAAAEGRLRTARTYPFNPEISLEAANRDLVGGSSTDRSLALSQEIELGGKRRRRVTGSASARDAEAALLRREERSLAARVRAAFVEALRARDLLTIEQANAALARSMFEVAEKRFQAGAATQMEVNLAGVQVGRADRNRRLREADFAIARAILAETIGLDAVAATPLGELRYAEREMPDASALVDSALARRADLEAFRQAIRSARARVELARREVVPNLVVGGFYGHEERTDRLLGGTIGLRIPLFNRNRGAIAEARATVLQMEAGSRAAELRARQEVISALELYRAGADATRSLQEKVLGSLQENLRLLQRSFETGKTGWTEVLVFRREFVEAERQYVDTLADARIAEIELDLALGNDALPPGA